MKFLLSWLLCSSLMAEGVFPMLINGSEVPVGSYKGVVKITTGSAACTATVVGKRALITAAHCAANGATSSFKLDGTSYTVKMTRSPLYPGKDHDISIGLIDKDVMVPPHTIVLNADVAGVGNTLHLLGYGCTQPGGGGGNDGILRHGDTTITGFNGYDIVSKKPGGAALCFGDSGGPAFLKVMVAKSLLDESLAEEREYLVSINSKGNIIDTNYTARLDSKTSIDFLKQWATTNNVEVCGVNANCDGPLPPEKKFTLDGNTIKITGEIKGDMDIDYAKRMTENLVRFLDTGK